MKVLRILAASMALLTLLAVGAPALAKEKHDEHGQQGQHQNGQQDDGEFDDLQDVDWAQLGIEKAYQLGLMLGEGAKHFNPRGPITREAAVVTAVRLMGLDSQAKADAGATLNFTDANRVDDWARGYLAVAVEKGILPPMGDGQLRPREPATRLWVSVLLVKALGYEAEAQSKMNVQLPFADAGLIPANLVGYVAAAVDHHLVTGYDDKTFKPNKPVTRAEMAALLGRSDDQLGFFGPRAGQMQGTVQAVDAGSGTLTVKGAHGTITATLTSNAAIFVNGRRAALSDVQVGMHVWVKLNADMQITLVDAKASDNGGGGPTLGQTVSGTLTAVVLPQNGYLGAVTIQPVSGAAVTASVAPMAQITGPNGNLTLADLHTGDSVRAQVVAGIVIQLTLTTPVTGTVVQGRLAALILPSGNSAGSITVAPDAGGASVSAAVYSNTAVTAVASDGTIAAKTLSDLTVGSEVKATISGGTATGIQIILPATTSSVQGLLTAVTMPSGSSAGSITVAPDGGGASVSAAVYSNVAITMVVNGTARAASLSDLVAGSRIVATLANGVATSIQITLPVTTSVQGKVMAFTAPSGPTAGTLVLLPDGAATATSYSIGSSVTVSQGSTARSFADLTLNTEVRLTLMGGTVTHVEIV